MTIATNRYWDSKGQHQALYEQVKGLIPKEGPSDNPDLETLRRVSRCYYDVYNNGAWNGFLFAGMADLISNASIDQGDRSILQRLFNAASEQTLQIWFAHRDAPIDESDEDDEDDDWEETIIIQEEEFSQALENLVSWAVKQAWFAA